MSFLTEKIDNTRLTMNAQNKVHSLDEFRSMVNYVNTTNRGTCASPPRAATASWRSRSSTT